MIEPRRIMDPKHRYTPSLTHTHTLFLLLSLCLSVSPFLSLSVNALSLPVCHSFPPCISLSMLDLYPHLSFSVNTFYKSSEDIFRWLCFKL